MYQKDNWEINNPTIRTGSTGLDKTIQITYCLVSKLKVLENAKLWQN